MINYRILLGLASFLLASTALANSPAAAAASCESLTGLKLADTVITVAQSEAAGTFTPPRSRTGAKPVPVGFCRVSGFIRPTSDSNIGFELWLPLTGWTGRYISIGNGGMAGSISFADMVGPLEFGAAVGGTDDGHQTAGTQADWALGHPQKLIDYGYRAVHLTAVVGKAISAAFYSGKPGHSYFVGCSTGGREGLTEAQRYPDDFDGIVAGAPANQYVKMVSGAAAMIKANMSSEAGFISQADAQKVGAAITAQCDALDGVKDGVINDPRQCKIDMASLPLTPAQLKTYEVFHDGPKNSSGQTIAPGLPFGSEAVAWSQAYAGPSFAETRSRVFKGASSNATFGDFIYNDPKWDFMSFDSDKGPEDAAKTIGGIMNSTDPSMAAFRAHGGKLISYHGWADAMITPLGTVSYYDSVIAAQGGVDKAQSFYRLFMVPGMGHCGGGPGANQFGQFGGGGDADHDVVAAMEQWVEKGKAPAKIIATRFVGNDPAKGVEMTRPICAYPKVTTYKGSGDTKDAASFTCADPAK